MDKSKFKEIIFQIEGMSCNSCALRIENNLKKIEGVIEASVNYTGEKVKLKYDPESLRLTEIKNSIIKIGYKLIEPENNYLIDKESNKKEKEIRIMFFKFFISVFFSIPLLYLAMAPMVAFVKIPLPDILDPMHYPLRYAFTQLILTLPVIAAGYKFYTSGFRSLFSLSPNMDSLVAIGTSSAFIYSLVSLYQISRSQTSYMHSLYFESAAVIITLILLGKSLENYSKGKTGDAIKKLLSLSPKSLTVIKDGYEKIININEVEKGDIILVKPGERIAVDGIITEGTTSIDESMLTGESIPVEKKTGDSIVGGSINKLGSIKFQALKVGEETFLSGIIRLVSEAQSSKAPISKLADKISGFFVPAVILIAVLSGLFWFLVIGAKPAFSLKIFISILVVACPCALGLATPTAVMVGMGKGANLGILIKNGEALEIASKLTTVVLDKTGTITEGRPSVTDILPANNFSDNELIYYTASAEKKSEHPLADSIITYAKNNNIKTLESKKFTAIPGAGIKSYIDGKEVLTGNQNIMNDNKIDFSELIERAEIFMNQSKTVIFTAVDNKAAGIIAITDKIKNDSHIAVNALKSKNIDVIMITGDNLKTAKAVGEATGINTIFAEVKPDQKSSKIKELKKNGKIVAMVGDGINDAVALAESDVGIAIGAGTDIAVESADIILMKNSLTGIISAVNLSKAVLKNIKQNLFWAFGYNILLIPIAMGLFYGSFKILMNPMLAAFAMSFSSVSVVTNALRLKLFKNQELS